MYSQRQPNERLLRYLRVLKGAVFLALCASADAAWQQDSRWIAVLLILLALASIPAWHVEASLIAWQQAQRKAVLCASTEKRTEA